MTSDERTSDPLLIVGAGAMGGSIGAALVHDGRNVLFVDRDTSHVEAIQRDGLRIEGPLAQYTVRAKATTPEALKGRYSTVLLCVKAHHTEAAVQTLQSHLHEDGCVVSIQNGLNEHMIARRVGADRTVGAFVNFGADLIEPGVVHWGGRGAVVLGELDGGDTARLRELHGVLRAFEPDALMTNNIFGFLWSKLAYAALLFATALTDDSIADILEARRYRSLNVAIAREVCRVAERRGVALEAFDGFDPTAFSSSASDSAAEASLDDLVAFNRRSAKTHSGIWRDLAVRKRRTEVDAQLGPVVEAGEASGVATPLVRGILDQVHEVEAGTRVRASSNLDELDLVRVRPSEQ